MKNLSFNDGLVRLSINNDESRIITINPTDVSIVGRYNEVIPKLDELVAKYQDTNTEDIDKATEILTELDKKAREFIDYIIGANVSDVAFGTANCLSFAGGKSIFENFLTAYMDFMTPTIQAEYEKSNKRVEKYTKQIAKK